MAHYTPDEVRPVLEAIVRGSLAAATAEAEAWRSAGTLTRWTPRTILRAVLRAAGVPVHCVSIRASHRGSSQTVIAIPAARVTTADMAVRQAEVGITGWEVNEPLAALQDAARRRVLYLLRTLIPEMADRSDLVVDFFDQPYRVELSYARRTVAAA